MANVCGWCITKHHEQCMVELHTGKELTTCGCECQAKAIPEAIPKAKAEAKAEAEAEQEDN